MILRKTGVVAWQAALLVCLLMFSGMEPIALSQDNFMGQETCLQCHENFLDANHQGLHWQASGGRAECESCHGTCGNHAESRDVSQVLTNERNPELFQARCTVCHVKMITGWKAHKMNVAGMNCFDCHRIHQAPSKGMLSKPQAELCTSCHIDIKGKMHLPSHHPMKHSRMECSSCHDFSGNMLFEPDRKNEMCLKCHAQYRGPFVFEHAPVAEDCMICHDPHGTVANNLLKQNEPFLCLSCHQMHFHTQLDGYEGEFTSPLFPDRGGRSNKHSMKSGMLTKCTQCHQPVHGSDNPSQGLSSGGKSLTR